MDFVHNGDVKPAALFHRKNDWGVLGVESWGTRWEVARRHRNDACVQMKTALILI